MTKTIHEAVSELHKSLVQYVEATYHISDPVLISQRNSILNKPGVLHQKPFIESTPKYLTGRNFRDIEGLPSSALQLFEKLSEPIDGKKVVYDPPYEHQADAVDEVVVKGRNIVIMTGTGSGKTESFLLPLLAKLAVEAKSSPDDFRNLTGMRALILYPMNALVNDQLGRLRSFFGNPHLQQLFSTWSGRIPRFARYTSRTPYAGVRSAQKDSTQLKPFRDFYVQQLKTAKEDSDDGRFSKRLINQLRERGKWPAKKDIETWYGADKTEWLDRKTGLYKRAVAMPEDAELLTRHEVQQHVPDLMVTNYSMLEYMMMRPIERSIFDKTKAWLAACPDEKFLVVLDEAHLYRGAAGAEVGYLLRRLSDRLGITSERLQVICATASFDNPDSAIIFSSQLTGTQQSSFAQPIRGTLAKHPDAAIGSQRDAEILAEISLEEFYDEDIQVRRNAVAELLLYRGIEANTVIEEALYQALKDYPPFLSLVNATMGKAQPIEEIGRMVFPSVDDLLAGRAASNLASLASAARPSVDGTNLFSCRVHSFHRGLRGLWICMDPECSHSPQDSPNKIAGKLYSQPVEECGCGSRVLELFTCRHCGTAYARGYVEDVINPRHVWPLPGARLTTNEGEVKPLHPIDILLESPPKDSDAEIREFDVVTGQFGIRGPRTRQVFLRGARHVPPQIDPEINDDSDIASKDMESGIFLPCGICLKAGYLGRSPVQDHETKGDQPFQVLVSKQLSIQPPGPNPATSFAPLRGRKVLAFSDSRQVAARLAPNLQMFASRDTLRALIVSGFKTILSLEDGIFESRLDDLYAAVMLAAAESDIRLRPETKTNESFEFEQVRMLVKKERILENPDRLRLLVTDLRTHRPPEALYADIYISMRDRARGLEALALGSIVEKKDKRQPIYSLPSIPGAAESNDEKIALVRAWLRCWHTSGFFLRVATPEHWYEGDVGARKVQSNKGQFKKVMAVILSDLAQRKVFEKQWLPVLLKLFAEERALKKYRLKGSELTLDFEGSWIRCELCKAVHRPISNICLECKRKTAVHLDPQNDNVFIARKGFYRNYALSLASAPFSLIAAEHTAQLNSPQIQDVFSKAEQNELLFQDVELPPEPGKMPFSAIDVLSSTTTMEVGIDIGQLSGVALRNMPPARANYQQRAGRAGRRGTSIATVVGFGGSDTHDEYYFQNPQKMISGKIVDPKLSLHKKEIAQRHIQAFLLQNYLQARVTITDQTNADLFSVLGTVSEFQNNGLLNIQDFERWLTLEEDSLRNRISKWLSDQLSDSDRQDLLSKFLSDSVSAIKQAIDQYEPPPAVKRKRESANEEHEPSVSESPPEVGEEKPIEIQDKSKLLDWLLYKAVLPRYAFPTDVATFYVFDAEKSSAYKTVPKFAPSQSLPVALSQYSPGKQVWISGKCYTSGALFSPARRSLKDAWAAKKIYLDCKTCGYSQLAPIGSGLAIGSHMDCDACGSSNSVGPLRHWIRPPGFAHPVTEQEVTSPDEIPETSYATRAQLTMPSPARDMWTDINSRLAVFSTQASLLVSNSGPQKEGYRYCVGCGRIEAETAHHKTLGKAHDKPYKDDNQTCSVFSTPNIVLGTDFLTDIALYSIRVQEPEPPRLSRRLFGLSYADTAVLLANRL
ncbi:DEAD/DEAH box helicase [Herbaspirillum rubrisubalbicans]|uniref:DEAD/DEAH box helicase n=2 Tax=Herbaspirillum rubrisubalbicans TaxID=80842 RepID=A0AAD0U4X7_9BURK|nr:DEAD/DEAH box helicase [Herbaspirillum rubrisubalbicans]AYR22306.1 DEAD/DEAH box helicase [Herbaspirillum rubrisubalbicans]